MPRLAAQLNHMFATVPRPSGRELWTNEDAAAAMTEAGVAISAVYLSQLRTGKRDNPSARHLAAIARLFAVPVEYFFDAGNSRPIPQIASTTAAIPPRMVKIVVQVSWAPFGTASNMGKSRFLAPLGMTNPIQE